MDRIMKSVESINKNVFSESKLPLWDSYRKNLKQIALRAMRENDVLFLIKIYREFNYDISVWIQFPLHPRLRPLTWKITGRAIACYISPFSSTNRRRA